MARSKHPFLSSVINDLWYSERTDRREALLNVSLTVRDAIPHVSDDVATTLQTALARIVLAEGETSSLHAEARTFAPGAAVPPDDTMAGEVRRAIHEVVRAQKRESSLAEADACATIEALVQAATAVHPRLGLSFGYIGNLPAHGWDDRSWRIFAKIATPSCVGACDVSFGGYATRDLPAFARHAAKELDTWCVKLERRLDEGKVRIVGDQKMAA